MALPTVEIPDRTLFRQTEVCELAQVQPYVLRSWEAEFPDLGVEKSAGSPRIYRRQDVERVLRLKHLLFVEGLTLAGARRKLEGETRPADEPLADLDELLNADARARLRRVKQGLTELQSMLASAPSGAVAPAQEFELKPAGKPRTRKKRPS